MGKMREDQRETLEVKAGKLAYVLEQILSLANVREDEKGVQEICDEIASMSHDKDLLCCYEIFKSIAG